MTKKDPSLSYSDRYNWNKETPDAIKIFYASRLFFEGRGCLNEVFRYVRENDVLSADEIKALPKPQAKKLRSPIYDGLSSARTRFGDVVQILKETSVENRNQLSLALEEEVNNLLVKYDEVAEHSPYLQLFRDHPARQNAYRRLQRILEVARSEEKF